MCTGSVRVKACIWSLGSGSVCGVLIDHKLERPPGQKINSNATYQIGVAYYAVKYRVTGPHNGGAIRVNYGSWSKSKVMA